MPDRRELPRSHEPEGEASLKISRRPVPVPTILTTFAVALTLLLAWKLSFMLLMGFAAILLGIAFRKTANYLSRFTGLSPTVSVFIVLAAAVLAGLLLVMMAGPQVTQQMRQLIAAIPQAWQQVMDWLNSSAIGNFLLERAQDSGQQGGEAASGGSGGGGGGGGAMGPFAGSVMSVFGVLRGTVNAVIGGIANLVLIVTVSIFLALNPGPYVQGVLRLVPMDHRDEAASILREIGDKLWSWLAGQSLDMLIVAILTGGGLWLLDIPLALVLGIIAGLTNAIPFIGPFISGVPAVLFSLTQGPQDALYVLLLFVAVQQLEGNVIMPLIQRHAAGLPPVMTIFGVIGFGVLFGLPGILVAAPLMVVAMVLVQRLYIEGVLGDDLPDHVPSDEDKPRGESG
ncbi:Predicted PurR-regulated permease PerM [Paracoccus isoporae]|uniref:Predicted PurR-regulated permease PerM n=1 Tax=Paracoccus isoporae TaxID=591205 RepID=A0A1G7AHU3_9RHOB|nr:AI-2E family transporter [Paracoccus isoporae]SDE14332.1 Predicted PurR-regulated permease PerM [Paracoccus isoporae]